MVKDERQERIINEVKLFSDCEIRPFVQEFEKNGGVSRSLINKLASNGYLGAPIPSKYGGLGLDPVYYGLFTKEIGKACVATRSLLTVHTSLVGETLLRWGNEEQKNKWLPLIVKGEVIAAFALSEPLVGSNTKSVKTTYIKKGDKFIINGTKKWITFGHIAELFIVIAANNGKATAFLVERKSIGLKTKQIEGLMAGRATYLAEIELNHVEVPEENILGKIDNGFEYVVNTALDNGRYSVAWGGAAIAEEAMEAMVSYSRNREQFGEKLRSFQLIRGIIGDAVTKVHAAKAICLRAGELRKEKDPENIMETNIAKYFTSKIAVEVANDALQVYGANGFTDHYTVERLYREAKVLEIIEGTSQIQQEMIAAFGLNKYYIRKK